MPQSRLPILLILLLAGGCLALWLATPASDPEIGPESDPSTSTAIPPRQVAAEASTEEPPPTRETYRDPLHASQGEPELARFQIHEEGLPFTFLDTNGRPIVAAKVYVYYPDFKDGFDLEGGPGLSAGVERRLWEKADLLLTDEEGIARVQEEEDFLYVGIRSEDFFDYRLWTKEDSRTLTVRAPLRIPCEVQDAQGIGVAGVPLLAGVAPPEGPIQGFQEILTDAKGKAEFLIFERFRPLAEWPDGHRPDTVGTLGLLTRNPQRIPFSLEEEPEEPLLFQWEPSASLELTIQDDSASPPENGYFVRLFSVHPSEGESMETWAPTDLSSKHVLHAETQDGTVRFPHLGLGQHFVFQVFRLDSMDRTYHFLEGPTRQGETKRAVIDLPEARPSFRGRLVNDGGRTGAGLTFPYLLHDPSRTTYFRQQGVFTTDGEGYFHLEPDQPLAPGMQLELLISAPKRSRDANRAVRVDLTHLPRRGLQDLGELTIVEGSLLADGQVLTPDGTPLAGVEIQLSSASEEVFRAGHLEWQVQEEVEVVTDGTERFRIHGFPKGAYTRLEVSSLEYYSDPMEFTAPATDLLIQAKPTWTLAGKVLPPESFRDDILFLEFTRTDGPQGRVLVMAMEENGWQLEPRGPLHPGTWRLTSIQVSGLLREFELGPEGGTRDLGILEIEEDMKEVGLRIKRADGEELVGATAYTLDGQEIHTSLDSEKVLMVPERLETVLVGSYGTRLTRVQHPRNGMEVVLEPGIAVSLTLENPPRLYSGWEVVYDIRSVGHARERPPFSASRNAFDGPVTAVELPYAGEFQVRVGLVNHMRQPSSTKGRAVITIGSEDDALTILVEDRPGPQVIPLTLDPSLLADAMHRMRLITR